MTKIRQKMKKKMFSINMISLSKKIFSEWIMLKWKQETFTGTALRLSRLLTCLLPFFISMFQEKVLRKWFQFAVKHNLTRFQPTAIEEIKILRVILNYDGQLKIFFKRNALATKYWNSRNQQILWDKQTIQLT